MPPAKAVKLARQLVELVKEQKIVVFECGAGSLIWRSRKWLSVNRAEVVKLDDAN